MSGFGRGRTSGSPPEVALGSFVVSSNLKGHQGHGLYSILSMTDPGFEAKVSSLALHGSYNHGSRHR